MIAEKAEKNFIDGIEPSPISYYVSNYDAVKKTPEEQCNLMAKATKAFNKVMGGNK